MLTWFYQYLLYRPIVKWLSKQRQISSTPLCNFDKIIEELQPGDVLLIEGRTRVSDIIKTMTQSSWSHAALYVGPIDAIENAELRSKALAHTQCGSDAPAIIESELGLGTVIRSADVYKGDHIRICRPRGLAAQDIDRIQRYCFSRLGSDYDVRQILDLLRWLLPWRFFPRKWRSSLFHVNSYNTRTICSTMIAEAFTSVKFPILPLVQSDGEAGYRLYQRNPKLFVPSDFDYSPYFDIIKYPFIDYENHGEYKLLPWEGDRYGQPETLRQTYNGIGNYPFYAPFYEHRILSRQQQNRDFDAVFEDIES